MIKIMICLLFAVEALATSCQYAPSNPEDRRPDKNSLTVVTYNCEFLVLNSSRCLNCCSWCNNETAAWLHLRTIASVIRSLNADIVNLAEVQDCYVLQQLNIAIGSDMNYRYYLIPGTDTITGQNMGLLTRVDPVEDLRRSDATMSYPISNSYCKKAAPGRTGVSKHYYTTFHINGINITMIGVHFKAIPRDINSCAQREAQAMIIQQVINEQIVDRGYEGIVLGDMNDYDDEITDAASDYPISQVLRILKAPGLSSTAIKIVDGSPNIYTDWYDKNKDCVFNYPSEATAIDHMLVSEKLMSLLHSSEDVHAYIPNCTNYYSDHWPIVSVFEFSSAVSSIKFSQGTIACIMAGLIIFMIILGIAIWIWDRRYNYKLSESHEEYSVL